MNQFQNWVKEKGGARKVSEITGLPLRSLYRWITQTHSPHGAALVKLEQTSGIPIATILLCTSKR